MNKVQIEPLSVIVAWSETMLRCAQDGEWLALAELEAKRRALIAVAMAALPDVAEDQDHYRQILQRVLRLDQQILPLAQAGHTELAKQLQTISVGRSAMQAYAVPGR
jgi:hypothetical protein